jgi:hypothetical protein
MTDTGERRLEAQSDEPLRQSAEVSRGVATFLERVSRPAWSYPIFALSVVLLWCVYYGRWPGTPSFRVPVNYLDAGDVLLVLGVARGFSEFPPPWNLHVDRLNAPFGADWNDYPHTEKLIFYPWGLLQRLISVGSAANVFVLIAHLGSGLAFVWCARRMGRSAGAAYAGGMLFAFSHFIVGRALGHVNVSIVWHIPLLLYLTLRLATREGVPGQNIRRGSYGVALATSFMNPYYPPLAVQLLALGTLRSFLQKRRAMARFGLALVLLVGCSFVAGQLNVYIRAWTAGPNSAFEGRSLEAIRIWALRLPDLFLPGSHPITAWQTFARKHYFDAGNSISENSFAFLGIVGCPLLVGLVVVSLTAGLRGEFRRVPWQAWIVLYVLLFALSGGLDYLIGSLGITWLRAVNRYSIVIQCLVLFWGCDMADRIRQPSLRYGTLVGAGALALFELFGTRSPEHARQLKEVAAKVDSDLEFGRALEDKLPKAAAVFELPVMPFPESVEILKMKDGEHFRPYLWTRALRFSYGTHKGRPREAWQTYAEQLPARDMVRYLGDHGFQAVLVNRKGMPHQGRDIETRFGELGLERLVESKDHEMIAFRIDKKASKLPLDYSSMVLSTGFPWGWEGAPKGERWAWSDGNAVLRLVTPPQAAVKYRVTFRIESMTPRNVEAFVADKLVARVSLVPGDIPTVQFVWPDSGVATLTVRTDVPAQHPRNGDPRRLSFRIIDPVAVPVPGSRN